MTLPEQHIPSMFVNPAAEQSQPLSAVVNMNRVDPIAAAIPEFTPSTKIWTPEDNAWLQSQNISPEVPVEVSIEEQSFQPPSDWREEVAASAEARELEIVAESAHVALTKYLGYDPRTALSAAVAAYASEASRAAAESVIPEEEDDKDKELVGAGR